MIETKAMIIHQMLKLNRPFKPRHIWEPLGISSQNLNNHLVRLVNKGILSKAGSIYTVTNQELLVDELTATSELTSIELPGTTALARESTTELLNNLLLFVTASRALEKDYAGPLTVAMNLAIDEHMDQLKTAKKFLNRKQFSERRAETQLSYLPDVVELVWPVLGGFLSRYMTEVEFKNKAVYNLEDNNA